MWDSLKAQIKGGRGAGEPPGPPRPVVQALFSKGPRSMQLARGMAASSSSSSPRAPAGPEASAAGTPPRTPPSRRESGFSTPSPSSRASGAPSMMNTPQDPKQLVLSHRNLRNRLEEAALNLEMQRSMNQHLNGEVQGLMYQLERLQQAKAAELHNLTAQLSRYTHGLPVPDLREVDELKRRLAEVEDRNGSESAQYAQQLEELLHTRGKLVGEVAALKEQLADAQGAKATEAALAASRLTSQHTAQLDALKQAHEKELVTMREYLASLEERRVSQAEGLRHEMVAVQQEAAAEVDSLVTQLARAKADWAAEVERLTADVVRVNEEKAAELTTADARQEAALAELRAALEAQQAELTGAVEERDAQLAVLRAELQAAAEQHAAAAAALSEEVAQMRGGHKVEVAELRSRLDTAAAEAAAASAQMELAKAEAEAKTAAAAKAVADVEATSRRRAEREDALTAQVRALRMESAATGQQEAQVQRLQAELDALRHAHQQLQSELAEVQAAAAAAATERDQERTQHAERTSALQQQLTALQMAFDAGQREILELGLRLDAAQQEAAASAADEITLLQRRLEEEQNAAAAEAEAQRGELRALKVRHVAELDRLRGGGTGPGSPAGLRCLSDGGTVPGSPSAAGAELVALRQQVATLKRRASSTVGGESELAAARAQAATVAEERDALSQQLSQLQAQHSNEMEQLRSEVAQLSIELEKAAQLELLVAELQQQLQHRPNPASPTRADAALPTLTSPSAHLDPHSTEVTGRAADAATSAASAPQAAGLHLSEVLSMQQLLQTQLAAAEAAAEAAQERLREARTRAEAVEEELGQLRQQLASAADSRATESALATHALEAARLESAAELRAKGTEVAALRSEFAGLQEAAASARQEADVLQLRLSTAEAAASSHAEEMRSRRASSAAAIQNEEQLLRQLTALRAEHADEVEALRKQLDAAKAASAEAEQLGQDLEQVQQDLEALQMERAAEVGALMLQLQKAHRERDSAERRAAELTSRATTVTAAAVTSAVRSPTKDAGVGDDQLAVPEGGEGVAAGGSGEVTQLLEALDMLEQEKAREVEELASALEAAHDNEATLESRCQELAAELAAAQAASPVLPQPAAAADAAAAALLQAELDRVRQGRRKWESEAGELGTALQRALAEKEAAEKRAAALQSRLEQHEHVSPAKPMAVNGDLSRDAALDSLMHSAEALATPEPDGNGIESWMSDGRWQRLRVVGTAGGWLIDPAEVRLGGVIGEGSFGTTSRGLWRGGDVAVKCVRISNPDEAGTFLREVELLSLLRHPNIMPFYGACLRPPTSCWLVCEYLPGGTLTSWIYGKRVAESSWMAPKRSLEAKLQVALEVARGMQALEDSDPPILHRDLKPSNVLIDAAGHARISDMGLARQLTPDSVANLTGETGTYFYMAPEVVRHEIYDGRADVYSWGVMFVEILNQKPPYDGMYLTPVQVAIAVGEDKLRPALPRAMHPDLAALADACFDAEPLNRPSFRMIVGHLCQLMPELIAEQKQTTSVFGRLFSSKSIPTAAAAGSDGSAASDAAGGSYVNVSHPGTPTWGDDDDLLEGLPPMPP